MCLDIMVCVAVGSWGSLRIVTPPSAVMLLGLQPFKLNLCYAVLPVSLDEKHPALCLSWFHQQNPKCGYYAADRKLLLLAQLTSLEG